LDEYDVFYGCLYSTEIGCLLHNMKIVEIMVHITQKHMEMEAPLYGQ